MKHHPNTEKLLQLFDNYNLEEFEKFLNSLNIVDKKEVLESLAAPFWNKLHASHRYYCLFKIAISKAAAECNKMNIFTDMLNGFSLSSQLRIIDDSIHFIKYEVKFLLEFAESQNYYKLFNAICNIYPQTICAITNSPFSIQYIANMTGESIIAIENAIKLFNQFSQVNNRFLQLEQLLRQYGVCLLSCSNYKGLRYALDNENFSNIKIILQSVYDANNPYIYESIDAIFSEYLASTKSSELFNFLIVRDEVDKLKEFASLTAEQNKKFHIWLYLKEYQNIETLEIVQNISLSSLAEKIIVLTCTLTISSYLSQVLDHYQPTNNQLLNIIQFLAESSQRENYSAISLLSTKVQRISNRHAIWDAYNSYEWRNYQTNHFISSLFKYAFEDNKVSADIDAWVRKKAIFKEMQINLLASTVSFYWRKKEFDKVETIFCHDFVKRSPEDSLNKLLDKKIYSNFPLAMKLILQYAGPQHKVTIAKKLFSQIPINCDISTYEETINQLSNEQFTSCFNLNQIICFQPPLIIKSFAKIETSEKLINDCYNANLSILGQGNPNEDFTSPIVAAFVRKHCIALPRAYSMTQLQEIKECAILPYLLSQVCKGFLQRVEWCIIYNGITTTPNHLIAIGLINHKMSQSSKDELDNNWINGIDKVVSNWCKFLHRMADYCNVTKAPQQAALSL